MPSYRDTSLSAAEIVEGDVLFLNAQIVQHTEHSLVHHGRAAHVVLDIFGSRMVLQIVVVEHLMDEPCVAVPVIFGQRFGECQMELEVRELLLDRAELVDIEQLAHAASAVPIGDFAIGVADS